MPGAPIVGGAQPPLQTSGAIGLSDINNQFERTWNSTIQLRLAETGYYAGVNPWSTYKPNAAAPAALSEWYGYHHTQPMPTHNVTASAGVNSYITDGVRIAISIGEGAAASVTFNFRVYWIDDFTSVITDSLHNGTIMASNTSVLVDCYAPAFGKSYYSVAIVSATPNPNYDQQYVW